MYPKKRKWYRPYLAWRIPYTHPANTAIVNASKTRNAGARNNSPNSAFVSAYVTGMATPHASTLPGGAVPPNGPPGPNNVVDRAPTTMIMAAEMSRRLSNFS